MKLKDHECECGNDEVSVLEKKAERKKMTQRFIRSDVRNVKKYLWHTLAADTYN